MPMRIVTESASGVREDKPFVVGSALLAIVALSIGDGLAAALSFTVSTWILGHLPALPPESLPSELSLSILAVLLALVLVAGGEPLGRGSAERLRTRATCATLFLLGFAAWGILAGESLRPAIVLLALPMFLILSAILDAALRTVFSNLRLWGCDVVVVGKDEAVRRMALTLQSAPDAGLRPVGIVDMSCRGGSEAFGPSAIPVFSSLAELPEEVRRHALGLLLRGEGPCDDLDATAGRLLFREVVVVPAFPETHAFALRSGRFSEAPAPIGILASDGASATAKMLFDRLVGVVLLLACAPLLVILALIVRLSSPGPAFYRQIRIGRDGRPFALWKLRTMHVDAEARLVHLLAADPVASAEWGSSFKLKNDPRVIPVVGHLLRRLSLDELPQLWNVVRGDMSMVGPRPFPTYHLERFDEEFRRLRCSVPPGLTGLWQVSVRSDGDLFAQQQLDTHYIRNRSVWLDLHILALTVFKVFAGSGAR